MELSNICTSRLAQEKHHLGRNNTNLKVFIILTIKSHLHHLEKVRGGERDRRTSPLCGSSSQTWFAFPPHHPTLLLVCTAASPPLASLVLLSSAVRAAFACLPHNASSVVHDCQPTAPPSFLHTFPPPPAWCAHCHSQPSRSTPSTSSSILPLSLVRQLLTPP